MVLELQECMVEAAREVLAVVPVLIVLGEVGEQAGAMVVAVAAVQPLLGALKALRLFVLSGPATPDSSPQQIPETCNA